MKKFSLSLLIASLFSMPFVFANPLSTAFEPLFDVLLQLIRIGSFSWLEARYYGMAVKFIYFIVLLTLINNSKVIKEKVLPDNKARGVVAFAVSAISVIFLPAGVETFAGNIFGVFSGLLITAGPLAYIMYILYNNFKHLPDGRGKNLAFAFLFLFAFFAFSVIGFNVGVNTVEVVSVIYNMITVSMFIIGIFYLIFAFVAIKSNEASGGALSTVANIGRSLIGANPVPHSGNSWTAQKFREFRKKRKDKKKKKKSIKKKNKMFKNITKRLSRLEVRLIRRIIQNIKNIEESLKDGEVFSDTKKQKKVYNSIKDLRKLFMGLIKTFENEIQKIIHEEKFVRDNIDMNTSKGQDILVKFEKLKRMLTYITPVLRKVKEHSNNLLKIPYNDQSEDNKKKLVENNLNFLKETITLMGNFIGQSEADQIEIEEGIEKVTEDKEGEKEEKQEEEAIKEIVTLDKKVIQNLSKLKENLNQILKLIQERKKDQNTRKTTLKINSQFNNIQKEYGHLINDLNAERTALNRANQSSNNSNSSEDFKKIIVEENKKLTEEFGEINSLKSNLHNMTQSIKRYEENRSKLNKDQKQTELDTIAKIIETTIEGISKIIGKVQA